jgi:hypothetical protein
MGQHGAVWFIAEVDEKIVVDVEAAILGVHLH